MSNLKPGIQTIDWSSSSAGYKSVQKLWGWFTTWFENNCLSLKRLNLSNNKLSDRAGVCLSKGLRSVEIDLEELDLSKNLIGDMTPIDLAKFIEFSYTMKILNLGWNNISAKGGIPLFFSIYKGRTLRNLNMSYNCLGRGNSIEIIEMVVEAVNEETLKHLDLSFNNLNFLYWK